MGKLKVIMLVMIVGMLANHSWADEYCLAQVKKFRIKYRVKGPMSKGETITQCRNWCNELAETRNIKISAGSMTQHQNTRSLTIKDKIYTTDLDTGRTTVANNPMYESVLKTVKRKGVKNLHESMLETMGFQPTDNVRKIAGETCRDYTSEQMMGVTNCFTDDGLALRTEMPGMMVQVAYEVERGNPGDETAYNIPKNAVRLEDQTQPGMGNLEEIMKKMKMPTQNE